MRVGIFRFIFEPINNNNILPSYLGFAWRGLLGQTLKEIYCPLKLEGKCASCDNTSSCLYYNLYERKVNIAGKIDSARPYILRPIKTNDDLLHLEVTLVGISNDDTLELMKAWIKAGEKGLGKEESCRIPFRILQVSQRIPKIGWIALFYKGYHGYMENSSWPLSDYLNPTYPTPPWQIKIITPIRQKKQHSNGYCDPSCWDWGYIFTRFGNRIDRLHYICSNNYLTKEKWLELKAFLNTPGESLNKLYWCDLHRWSSRQKKRIPEGGIKGTASILPPKGTEKIWWYWWQAASILHFGKGTSMGLGKIICR